jgi:DNA-binding MarR family transcriptional regulator
MVLAPDAAGEMRVLNMSDRSYYAPTSPRTRAIARFSMRPALPKQPRRKPGIRIDRQSLQDQYLPRQYLPRQRLTEMNKHYDAKSFTSGKSIGYLVKLAHLLMVDRATEAFAGHDLSFVQWVVMIRLKEGSEVTASDLCRALRHDTGALTRLLDQLEERGYVSRERSKEDRRVVQLQLTAAGLQITNQLTPIVIERLNSALGGFTKAEFNELSRLLTKLVDTLQAAASAGES